MSDQKVDPPALDLDEGKRSEFGLGEHTADQETASTQPVEIPESGTANPNKTGVY
jgi:hypothetical protein